MASVAAGPRAGAAMAEFSHGKQQVAGGGDLLAQLQAENAQLRAELSALRTQVQELQRRLGLDSSNSGRGPRWPSIRTMLPSPRVLPQESLTRSIGGSGEVVKRTIHTAAILRMRL